MVGTDSTQAITKVRIDELDFGYCLRPACPVLFFYNLGSQRHVQLFRSSSGDLSQLHEPCRQPTYQRLPAYAKLLIELRIALYGCRFVQLVADFLGLYDQALKRIWWMPRR